MEKVRANWLTVLFAVIVIWATLGYLSQSQECEARGGELRALDRTGNEMECVGP
jgi:hypothetical protein